MACSLGLDMGINRALIGPGPFEADNGETDPQTVGPPLNSHGSGI